VLMLTKTRLDYRQVANLEKLRISEL
jgi:hypothetical protein